MPETTVQRVTRPFFARYESGCQAKPGCRIRQNDEIVRVTYETGGTATMHAGCWTDICWDEA